MIYVFTGEGKGKTSAAIGVAVRMLLSQKRVVWISWFKNRDWQISEMKLESVFPDLIKMYWVGEGFYIKEPSEVKSGVKIAKVNKGRVIDDVTPEDHKKSAREALLLVENILGGNGQPDLVVMDEAIQAIKEGLIEECEVLRVIKMRRETNIILTGRSAGADLIELADLVTEMRKIKHPYDVGKMAVKGLDY